MSLLTARLVAVFLVALPLTALSETGLSETEAQAEHLSLADAVGRALEANHTVGRSRADAAAADADVRLALAERRPRFTLEGQGVWNQPDVVIPFGEDLTVRLLPEADGQANLRLTQPLYTGGRLKLAHSQARVASQRARDDLQATEDEVLLRVVTSYLGVARGDALMAVEEQSLALAEKRLYQSESFYEAGEVTRVDVLRARAAITGAERRIAGARQLRETSLGQLRVDLAATEGENWRVEWPETLLPPGLEPMAAEAQLLDRAVASRPEVAAARRGLELAEMEVEAQRSERRPSLLAEGTFTQQRGNFPAERFGAVALGFSVPLYQGGRIAARTTKAELRVEQARLGLAEVELNVREAVRRLLMDLHTAETNLVLSQELLAAVEAEYAGVSALYEALEVTSLDLASAELALAEARRSVVNSKLDRDLAEVRVFFATGDLRNALGLTVSPGSVSPIPSEKPRDTP